jgi:sugar/nucleoside kinase (ribokinase family)
MDGIPEYCSYTGCVGDDELGKQQQQLMEDAGIKCIYNIAKGERTGYLMFII